MESLVSPTVVDDEYDATVYHEVDNEGILKPKRKRQKKLKKPDSIVGSEFKNVRGRRGALKDIVEMHLDILHEIFMYLTPPDVLHLSRTCKALRRILMAKSTEFIWKQARFNLDDFPGCPDDLNEAQFARFMFDTLCDYCKERKAPHFLWSVRRRSCKKCITNRNGLEPLYYLPQFFAGDSCELQAILPSFNASGNEVDEVSSELDQDAVVICVMSAAQMRAEFLDLDSEAQTSWMRAKTKERKDRISHGLLCKNWILRQTEIRALRLNDARQRRYAAIKQKLIDLGWGEELKFMHDFKQWSPVKQPKDLTERIWLNIKNDLIKKLKDHKTLRLEKDYLAAQKERSQCLSDCLFKLRSSTPLQKRIFPSIADIRQMEPFSSLLMAPALEKVEFSQLMLEEASNNWRSSKETELRDMIISKSSHISCPTSVDILSLATTFFKCRREIWPSHSCSSTIGFPEVLVHPCAWEGGTTWNSNRIPFDQKAHSLAKTILEASGLDYNLTTREEVHRPDFYVECHDCPLLRRGHGERIILTWHSAIEHALSHPSQDTGLRMARAKLSRNELSVVKELGNKQLLQSQITRYKCMRCEETDYTWFSLSTHVMYKHGQRGTPIYLKDYDLAATQSGFSHQPEDPLVLKPKMLSSTPVTEISKRIY